MIEPTAASEGKENPASSQGFARLFGEELAGLDEKEAQPSFSGEAPENWVTEVRSDLVGLALSGGGIRSATFNLGFLQGLDELRLLDKFHYLSTVSGGGYIGGWWSAWRARLPLSPPVMSPPSEFFGGKENGAESREVRHLREFSNFLSPRLGFFSMEFWHLLGSFLGAFLPSVLVATSVIASALVLWYWLLAVSFRPPHAEAQDLWVPLAILLVLASIELASFLRKRVAATAASVLGALLFHGLAGFGLWLAIRAANHHQWWPEPRAFVPELPGLSWFSRALYLPSIVTAVVAASLILLRAVFSRLLPVLWNAAFLSSLERVFARLVAAGVVWTVAILVWDAAAFLPDWGAIPSLAMSVSSGGVFAYLSRLLTLQPSQTRRVGWRDKIRVLLPQVVAYVAIALAILGIAGALLNALQEPPLFEAIGAASFALILAASFFFDPNEIGLHAFYRSRIGRAYLGASNFQPRQPGRPPDDNRQTGDKAEDDLPLNRLPVKRPLHLVCCAANDLAGDHLANLGRDAASAVFSTHGFATGDFFHPWQGRDSKNVVTLGSALTASAAAFNSNMGSKARNFGRAAPFLMSAFGLRLGLWFRAGGPGGVFRGLAFFREMFGLTSASTRTALHLSDGGHFENMGLYELVRRHCRYILASDCGADPQVAFDDFGNALRRVREDFGVEIDLNLAPLKPEPAGFSAQHVSVGDIQYPDGDRGVLVLIKPTLVGSEPDDILQYRARNPAFPHESTGDQFYDEAQWESYRRLGSHVARSVFGFARWAGTLGAPELFARVRNDFYPASPNLQETVLERSAQLFDIEKQLAGRDCEGLLREIYPDLAPPAPPSKDVAPTALRELPVLVQMIQLMEDVFWGCRLETLWNHPLNTGWVNYFGRWASAATFRRYWPVLKPMYSPSFARFVENTFALQSGGWAGRVTHHPGGVRESKLATRFSQFHRPLSEAGKEIYSFDLTLEGGAPVELAFVLIEKSPDSGETVAAWTASDFVVPVSLWGSGIGHAFLRRLIPELRKKYSRLRVTVESSATAEANTKAASDLLRMYIEQDFRVISSTAELTVLELPTR